MEIIELTDGEKKMLSTGLVFSTSKANPLFIKEGFGGGNYVCEAFIIDEHLNLFIYDLALETESQKIWLKGEEIDQIPFGSRLKISSDGKIDRSVNWNGCSAWEGSYYLSDGSILDCDNDENFKVRSDKYENLPLDTQAKRFFIDILKIYLKDKKEREEATMKQNSDNSTSEENVSPV